MTEKLARLAAAGIQLLPAWDITSHYVFERDGFVAMVARIEDGFGEIGSPGLLTEKGFAALVWRRSKPYFLAKDFVQPATEGQIAKLREFAADLRAALR